MRSFLAISLAFLLVHCGNAWRDASVTAANATAAVANAGGEAILSGYCSSQMAAIGRQGTRTGERCEESGTRAGTPATPEELRALDGVRSRWAPVIEAHTAVALAHDALRALLAAAEDAQAQRLPAVLAGLAAAYGSLLELARVAGLTLPTLPSATGPPATLPTTSPP